MSERQDWLDGNQTMLERLHQEVLACGREHRKQWVVTVRRANYSAFNGYHRTRSDYSELQCHACGRRWRTKASYVARTPDGPYLSHDEIKKGSHEPSPDHR